MTWKQPSSHKLLQVLLPNKCFITCDVVWKKGFFTKYAYDNTHPCGSKLARIYGNPKTDKLKFKTDKLTFHPIVSSIGTYNYKLAKFLGELLNPIIPSQHCATDSFSFCKEIQEVSTFDKFMISYDVCNLSKKSLLKKRIN